MNRRESKDGILSARDNAISTPKRSRSSSQLPPTSPGSPSASSSQDDNIGDRDNDNDGRAGDPKRPRYDYDNDEYIENKVAVDPGCAGVNKGGPPSIPSIRSLILSLSLSFIIIVHMYICCVCRYVCVYVHMLCGK